MSNNEVGAIKIVLSSLCKKLTFSPIQSITAKQADKFIPQSSLCLCVSFPLLSSPHVLAHLFSHKDTKRIGLDIQAHSRGGAEGAELGCRIEEK